ncbi:hypothetical protein HYI12_09380 [Acinetobacter sp. SwsAc3]|nr:hypothetical protein [Acinetobacter sp. SwsAc3]
MRMSQMYLSMALAAMGSAIFADGWERAPNSLKALLNAMRFTQPSRHKSKPNRVSQKKRRIYARQGRK